MISGASVGTAAGLVVGGMIVDSFNWHGIFFTSAGLCLCAVAATRAFVPASPLRKAPAPVDWVSGLAFAPGVALILVYFSMGKGWGWANGWGLAALIAGLSLVVWWVRQRSEEHTSELQSLMRISYAVFCLKKKKNKTHKEKVT